MDNSLKKKQPPKRGTRPSRKTKTFLIGKELKTNNLLKTATERVNATTTKPNPKPRIASAKGRVKPLARLLRYGPAGDSAPQLRL